MTFYVDKYFLQKSLAKLGYTQDFDALSVTDEHAFSIIENEINRYKNEQSKKAKLKSKRK